MVEISRVLQPGGVFVASTFLKTFSPLGEFLGDDTVRPLNQVNTFTIRATLMLIPLLAQGGLPSLGGYRLDSDACVHFCITAPPPGNIVLL